MNIHFVQNTIHEIITSTKNTHNKAYLVLRRAATNNRQHTDCFALLGNHSIGVIIIHVTAAIVVVEVFATTAFCCSG